MLKHHEIDIAADHLRKHTLPGLPGEIGKLVYLAGTRDYNTGRYYHDGLAHRFSEPVARKALEECHEETFRRLVQSPLKDLVTQLEIYVNSTQSPADEVIGAWQELEPYRVTIPLACDPLSSQLFCSNLKIALAILELRVKNRPSN
jgi:hypothetical protein